MLVLFLIIGSLLSIIVWLMYQRKISQKNTSVESPSLFRALIRQLAKSKSIPEPSSSNNQEHIDSGEGSFYEIASPYAVQARLRLNYIDSKGQTSDRTVDVREFGSTSYGAIIIGRCHERNATRTFRTDRIKHCVDEETGEIIDDVHAFLRNRYEKSTQYSLDNLLNNEYDVLRIMLYLGKSDGRLTADDREAITEACQSISADNRITDNQVKALLSRIDTPSIHAFKLAVGKIGKRFDAKTNELLISVSKKIINTQKKAHPETQSALDYIQKRLGDTSLTKE